MKRFNTIATALALAWLSACATERPTGTIAVTQAAAADHATFSAATLEAAQHVYTGTDEQVAAFAQSLRESLRTAGFTNGPGLTVRYRLVQYDPGSRGLRFATQGFGGGRGMLMFEVTYLDTAGLELARVNVRGDVNGAGSLNVAAAEAAQQAADFAVSNFKAPRRRR